MSIGLDKDQQTIVDLIEHLDGLYGYALVFCRNRSDAEDPVQETCLRALKSVDTLRPSSNVKGWLCTILRNIWLNQWKKSHTSPQSLDLQLDNNKASDTTTTTHAIDISNVNNERVRAAIQQLPLLFREIIILHVYEDLSDQEFAHVVNLPIGTITSYLVMVRRSLRALHFESSSASSSDSRRSSDREKVLLET